MSGPTIRRAPRPESRFTTVSKDITENTSLSWQARGLLVYLLGKFDNWQIHVSHLQKETCNAKKKTGRDGIYAMFDELLEQGYLQRESLRSAEGAFIGVQYVVHEIPVPVEQRTTKQARAGSQDEQPSSDENAAQPHTAKPDTDKPDTGLPDTGSPDTANPTLLKTDVLTKTDVVPKTEPTNADASPPAKSPELLTLERSWAPGIEKPEQLSDEDWLSLLRIRKAKRLMLTAKAMQLMESEAKKANLTLAEGMEYAVARGWAAFAYSYWLDNLGKEMQAQGRVDNAQRGGGYAPRVDHVTAAAQNVYDFDDRLVF